MTLLSILTLAAILVLLSCAIWLVQKGALAVSDPDAPMQPLEFAVASIVLLSCAIAISWYAFIYIVLPQEPDVPQSSKVVYDKSHQPMRARADLRSYRKHHPSMRHIKTR